MCIACDVCMVCVSVCLCVVCVSSSFSVCVCVCLWVSVCNRNTVALCLAHHGGSVLTGTS